MDREAQMRWIKRNSSRFPLFFLLLYSILFFFAWGLCRHAFRGLLVSVLTPLVAIPVACIHLLYAALSFFSPRYCFHLLQLLQCSNTYAGLSYHGFPGESRSWKAACCTRCTRRGKKTRNIYAFLFDEVLSTNDDLTD